MWPVTTAMEAPDLREFTAGTLQIYLQLLASVHLPQHTASDTVRQTAILTKTLRHHQNKISKAKTSNPYSDMFASFGMSEDAFPTFI